MTSEEKRLRYRNDPEYRKQMIEKATQYRAVYRLYPAFRALDNHRKKICRVRDSYHARVAHAVLNPTTLLSPMQRTESAGYFAKTRPIQSGKSPTPPQPVTYLLCLCRAGHPG